MAGCVAFELGRHGRLLQVVPGSRWLVLKRVPRHSVYGEIDRGQPSPKLLSNKLELGAPLLAWRRRRLHHVSKTPVEHRGTVSTVADISMPATRVDSNSYRQKSRAINKLERRTLRIRIPASPPVFSPDSLGFSSIWAHSHPNLESLPHCELSGSIHWACLLGPLPVSSRSPKLCKPQSA